MIFLIRLLTGWWHSGVNRASSRMVMFLRPLRYIAPSRRLTGSTRSSFLSRTGPRAGFAMALLGSGMAPTRWAPPCTKPFITGERVFCVMLALSSLCSTACGRVLRQSVRFTESVVMRSLIDLRPQVTLFPSLVDMEHYHSTQPIGARLKREGHPGLVSCSARCDGDVYAVLNANVLSGASIQSYLTYQLTAQGVRVSRGMGDTWMWIT